MCGIFGSVCENSDLDLNRASISTLKHRGPDQQGEYFDGKIYLGHQRLSILDLSDKGRQPMLSENIAVTVNGEIYNFFELKRLLRRKYNFVSTSDSEVILHGFTEWGINGLIDRIDGMYSIVVYDKLNQTIYLVRDRYGIKPLYYSLQNHTFCWASELKAITRFYGLHTLITDNSAVYDYLNYLYIPTPKTLYRNVFKLPPGSLLKFDLRNFNYTVTKYWKLQIEETNPGISEASEHVKNLIENSVKSQLISDVPLGFFLSGGIDSSIVVASASRITSKLNTYSIGFDISSHNETEYSRQVAELFKTKHAQKILDIESANNLFYKIKDWFDEPYADTSSLPTFLVSEFARESSTVVLTGDGGDELFGGYDWYQRYFKYQKGHIKSNDLFVKISSEIKNKYRYTLLGRAANQLEYRFLEGFNLYAKLLGGLSPTERKKYKNTFGIPEDYDDLWYFRKFDMPELSPRKRLQYIDFNTYLHDDIFTKVDRVSMSVALECRVPFMKKELVEFAFSLPEEILYYNNQKKGLLKFAYRDILPENILNRKKRGFNIPLSDWNNRFLKNSSTQQERILSLFNIYV